MHAVSRLTLDTSQKNKEKHKKGIDRLKEI
jgi:hypothetical protein